MTAQPNFSFIAERKNLKISVDCSVDFWSGDQGREFAQRALSILEKAGIDSTSHYSARYPYTAANYSWQIGDLTIESSPYNITLYGKSILDKNQIKELVELLKNIASNKSKFVAPHNTITYGPNPFE